MDIGKSSNEVASRLSNFTPREFIFDDVKCNSMEGLLQSFKFEKEHIQREICLLTGLKAKRKGQKRNKAWKRIQTLWWKNKTYKRDSIEYQKLLDKAFLALSTNKKFMKDLLSTGDAIFTHSIGKNKIQDTVLTEKEFCSRLQKLKNGNLFVSEEETKK